MTIPATDGKMLVNALYHSPVVSGLAAGYARLGKMATGDSLPKLDFTPCDVCMVVVDVALTMATKDMLIKQGLSQLLNLCRRHPNKVNKAQLSEGERDVLLRVVGDTALPALRLRDSLHQQVGIIAPQVLKHSGMLVVWGLAVA